MQLLQTNNSTTQKGKCSWTAYGTVNKVTPLSWTFSHENRHRDCISKISNVENYASTDLSTSLTFFYQADDFIKSSILDKEVANTKGIESSSQEQEDQEVFSIEELLFEELFPSYRGIKYNDFSEPPSLHTLNMYREFHYLLDIDGLENASCSAAPSSDGGVLVFFILNKGKYTVEFFNDGDIIITKEDNAGKIWSYDFSDFNALKEYIEEELYVH